MFSMPQRPEIIVVDPSEFIIADPDGFIYPVDPVDPSAVSVDINEPIDLTCTAVDPAEYAVAVLPSQFAVSVHSESADSVSTDC